MNWAWVGQAPRLSSPAPRRGDGGDGCFSDLKLAAPDSPRAGRPRRTGDAPVLPISIALSFKSFTQQNRLIAKRRVIMW
jgi:hypothetical protein